MQKDAGGITLTKQTSSLPPTTSGGLFTPFWTGRRDTEPPSLFLTERVAQNNCVASIFDEVLYTVVKAGCFYIPPFGWAAGLTTAAQNKNQRAFFLVGASLTFYTEQNNEHL
jgi:hypothetical protein